ncbi:MAG: hypothetical protein LC754_17110 [Acidobacteria bacterium]|nr:hypothetical protein [Acidobacteriota bacterium]
MHESRNGLVEAANLEAFADSASETLAGLQQGEILRRAINFVVFAGGESLEGSFISLYAALESTLTFFRREDEYEILPREEFSRIERDLKKWLKAHPLLEHSGEKRALIYEKIRELNRFPFAHVFRKFCERYAVDLSDLWPVVGKPEDWPLAEIRHRLVHGDPFVSRPAAALSCAHVHLRWTVERMLLSVLGWPVACSTVNGDFLTSSDKAYQDWRNERASFA